MQNRKEMVLLPGRHIYVRYTHYKCAGYSWHWLYGSEVILLAARYLILGAVRE